jgi:two-component system response regulator AtoC
VKKNPFKILAVDDDPKIIESIRLILERDYEVLAAQNGQEALEIISRKKIDLVFLDIQMPGGMSGLEVLKRIKDSGETIAVVMVTAANTAKIAVEAMKLGALDYLPKPFDPEEIEALAKKALENNELVKEVVYFRSQVEPTLFENIVGRSKPMQEVYSVISKVAPTDVTMLIEGESGTGKELVARAIHFQSRRKDKPFLAINCAGIPDTLLETELFGYEKGAFTGADRQKLGRFELAHEGTLFLDEVSSLRLDMQGKILRALQQKEIERVGGVKTIPIDVRILAASNVDLMKAVKEGKFREDLYYRLNVVPIALPPLRDRREDIESLLDYFLKIFNKKFNKKIAGISKAAVTYLEEYAWPGNIRELENMMERLVVLSDREIIDTHDLPFDIFLKSKYSIENGIRKSLILKDARDIFEKDYIQAVLERTSWNQTAAARLLGIHRNTLMMKTDQLGLRKDEA